MTINQSHLEQIEHLVKTLSALLRIMIDILPEGGGQDLDEEAFYTLLDKANQDLTELSIAISRCHQTKALSAGPE